MRKFWYLLFSLALCGCSVVGTPSATFTAEPIIAPTTVPTETATATPAPTATATAMPLITQIVSPLQGIPLNDLAGITSNPFKLKYPFSEGPSGDENHPAVDLGFYHYGTLNTDDGLPIQAILPGKVVETLDDRYPYGNMVLIETPLEALAPELITQMQIPQPYSEQDLKIHSTCLPDQSRIAWSQTGSSVYSLYAHMKNPPALKAGDQVQAGDLVGSIGYSGHSAESIEHLHLEVRVGPADARFGVISDYLSTSTEEERYNYCIWALSEVFLPINPSLFWAPTSNQGQ